MENPKSRIAFVRGFDLRRGLVALSVEDHNPVAIAVAKHSETMMRLRTGKNGRVGEKLVGGYEEPMHRRRIPACPAERKREAVLHAGSPCAGIRFMNVFANLPQPGTGEEFRELLAQGAVRIERIVSHGDVTPEGQWYEQGWDEWVLVLEGSATLAFDSPVKEVTLARGDSLLIESGRRHRVTRTDLPTIWLAVHWPGDDGSRPLLAKPDPST